MAKSTHKCYFVAMTTCKKSGWIIDWPAEGKLRTVQGTCMFVYHIYGCIKSPYQLVTKLHKLRVWKKKIRSSEPFKFLVYLLIDLILKWSQSLTDQLIQLSGEIVNSASVTQSFTLLWITLTCIAALLDDVLLTVDRRTQDSCLHWQVQLMMVSSLQTWPTSWRGYGRILVYRNALAGPGNTSWMTPQSSTYIFNLLNVSKLR